MAERLVIYGEGDLDLNEQIGDPDGDTLMVFNPQVMVGGAAQAGLTRRFHLAGIKAFSTWKPRVTYRQTVERIEASIPRRKFGVAAIFCPRLAARTPSR